MFTTYHLNLSKGHNHGDSLIVIIFQSQCIAVLFTAKYEVEYEMRVMGLAKKQRQYTFQLFRVIYVRFE